MSKQALENPYVGAQMMELLIEKFGFWEALRDEQLHRALVTK